MAEGNGGASDALSTAAYPTGLATCDCAVAQIKPAWDGKDRLVCEDCHGRITRAGKMSGQNARPGDTSTRLLSEAMYLAQFGERPPGGEDATWAKWFREVEAHLREGSPDA